MKGRARFRSLATLGPVPLSLALAGIVFAIDLFTPLGVASGVLYVLATLVALNAASRRYAFQFASLCTGLTVADVFVGPGPGGTEMWKVLTNRFLAIFMIWLTAILGVMRQKAEKQRSLAEEQTRLHLADLAHMGRLKTAAQLAASLAHELNQPLAAVSLQAEIGTHLMQAEPCAHANGASRACTQERLMPVLREITEQAQRAGHIVRSLRNLVQKGEPQLQPVDANDMAREVSRLIEPYARSLKTTVVLRLTDSPALVLADRVQIEQVLLNLLQNALQAMEARRADIAVCPKARQTGMSAPRVVELRTNQANGAEVLISVHDTGIGFAPENAELLFERFYSTKPSGLGMGLAISRAIALAHGGRLAGAPNPDQGATFTLTLPTSRP